mmetsp:Transcript_22113/g.48075  ORF Transcript_22113/g.48075 Transcript_22113/m.48075 type:complete len:120 (-) Transcript_22113:29-388(-)
MVGIVLWSAPEVLEGNGECGKTAEVFVRHGDVQVLHESTTTHPRYTSPRVSRLSGRPVAQLPTRSHQRLRRPLIMAKRRGERDCLCRVEAVLEVEASAGGNSHDTATLLPSLGAVLESP